MHGKSLGPFLVESTLGSGGMGTVYLARAEQAAFGFEPGERLALKVIHPHLIEGGDYYERFLREARVGAEVRHENVVEVYGVDEAVVNDAPVHYLVMTYVAGRTLREILTELGTVPESLLREIGRQVAEGLGAIHGEDIVHRDVKPENVILTDSDRIRIMDLGMARLIEGSVELTIEGHFAGSLQYAAPEQFNELPIGPRADIYSLGVLLYELATGVNPFRRDSPPAVMLAHLKETPEPLGRRNPELSPFLSEFVAALLAKDPGDRPESAHEVARILESGEESDWWTGRERDLGRSESTLPEIPLRRECPLLGRDRESDELREAFARALSGEGAVMLVEGETGIGKTRLLSEFLREEVRGSAATLYGAYLPLGGAGGISESILSHFGSADLEEALARHLRDTPTLVPAFAAHLRGEGAVSGGQGLAPDAMEALLVHLMHGLASERPLVWIIDDLHFSEVQSRKCFLSMARAAAGHRVLLIAAADVGVPEEEIALLSSLASSRRLALGRLGARDVVGLIRETFKSDALTDRLGAKIAYKSDGVPLFALEIIRGLREQGLIESLPDGTCVETEVIGEIEVPAAIRDLIDARLRELSDTDRSLLDVAAVMGPRFDPDLIARVRDLKRVHVLERLAAMERRNGVVRSGAGSSSFDHHQIREVIYEALIPDLKAEYHALLAEALEEREGVDADNAAPGEMVYLVALHHLEGARPEAGLPYLDPALEFLAGAYRNEAVLHLAELAHRPPGLLTGSDREEVLHRVATSLDVLGRRDEERAVLEEVVVLADEIGDPAGRVRARRRMGWNLLCVSRPEDARTWLVEAAGLAEAAADRIGFGLSTLLLGNVHWSTGGYGDARACYARALAIASEAGDRRLQARARGNLANVSRLQGEFEVAREHLRAAAAIFSEIGDRRNEGAAEGNLGNVYTDLGFFDQAQTHLLRGILIAREIGDRPHEGITLVNHGSLLLLLGDPEGAVEALTESRRILEEIGARLYVGYLLQMLGDADESLGREKEADGRFAEALELLRSIPNPSGIAIVLLSQGRLRQKQGRGEEAAACFEEAAEIGRSLGEPSTIVQSLGHLAGLPGGDPADAEQALTEYDARLGMVVRMKARFLLYLATGEAGHLEEARRLLKHLRIHAPEENRESLVESVPLHREISGA